MNLEVNPGLVNIGDKIINGGCVSIVYENGSRDSNVRYLKSKEGDKFFYLEFDNHSKILKVFR